jgi:hypothetical protein
MRNALAHVPKGQHTVVAAAIRQAFLQPDHASATKTWRQAADQLGARWPKLGTLMGEAEADVLATMSFPAQHRRICTQRMRWTSAFVISVLFFLLRGRPRGEEQRIGWKAARQPHDSLAALRRSRTSFGALGRHCATERS